MAHWDFGRVIPTLGADVIDRVYTDTVDTVLGRVVQARASSGLPVLRPIVNGAFVASGNKPPARRCVYGSDRWNVLPVSAAAQRHMKPVGRNLVFGSMNIRSLSKLDELLVEFNDQ